MGLFRRSRYTSTAGYHRGMLPRGVQVGGGEGESGLPEQVQLVILYSVFCIAAHTVEILVERLARMCGSRQRGHNEARVGLSDETAAWLQLSRVQTRGGSRCSYRPSRAEAHRHRR